MFLDVSTIVEVKCPTSCNVKYVYCFVCRTCCRRCAQGHSQVHHTRTVNGSQCATQRICNDIEILYGLVTVPCPRSALPAFGRALLPQHVLNRTGEEDLIGMQVRNDPTGYLANGRRSCPAGPLTERLARGAARGIGYVHDLGQIRYLTRETHRLQVGRAHARQVVPQPLQGTVQQGGIPGGTADGDHGLCNRCLLEVLGDLLE